MKLELNGKEIEIDLLDADTLEKYGKAIEPLRKTIELNGDNAIVYVKSFCKVVYDFFDTLLGEGSAQMIFDGKQNMKLCNDCILKCISSCEKYLINQFAKDADKITNSWKEFLA